MKKLTDQVPDKLKPYLPFVAVAAVLLIIWKFGNSILIALGFKKDAATEAYEKTITKDRLDVIEGAKKSLEEQYKVQPPTKSDAEFLQIADTIDTALNGEFIDDESKATYELCRMKNDSDVFKLIAAYGSRPTMTVFSMGFNNMTLPQVVNNELSKSQIDAVNNNYSRKGIRYRF